MNERCRPQFPFAVPVCSFSHSVPRCNRGRNPVRFALRKAFRSARSPRTLPANATELTKANGRNASSPSPPPARRPRFMSVCSAHREAGPPARATALRGLDSERSQRFPAFRGMGDPQEEGDHHHPADRDQGEAAGRSRGRRGRRRFRAPRHHQHDRGRRAAGAHDSGG